MLLLLEARAEWLLPVDRRVSCMTCLVFVNCLKRFSYSVTGLQHGLMTLGLELL